MEKIQKTKFIVPFLAIFIWLLVVGRGGGSGFFGQINFIDEGQFVAWIEQMMNGEMIYRDIYVQYGPLMVFPLYLLFQLFEPSIFIIKIWQVFDAFFSFIIAFATLRIFKVSKKLSYFVLLSLLIIPGLSFRIWVGVFTVIIAYLAFKKSSKILYFISGLLLSCLLFYSIDVGLFVLFTLVALFLIDLLTTNRLTKSVKKIGVFALGLLATLFIFVLFFNSQGWFYHYLYTTFAFSGSIAGNNLPNGMGLPNVPSITSVNNPLELLKVILSREMLFFISFISILYFLFLSLVGMIFSKDNRLNLLAFLISFYAILVFISIVGRSGHYFAVVPFVIVIGAYFVSQLLSSNKKIIGRRLKFLFLVLFLIYVTRHISIFRYSFIPDLQNISFSKIERVYPFYTSKEQAKEILALQNFFKEKKLGKQNIYILSNSPALYFLLDQSNSTKYDLPLLAGGIDRRYDLLNDLTRNPPKFIIEDTTAWAVDGVSDRSRMPEVFKFVSENYKVFGYASKYRIFVLNKPPDEK